MDKQRKPEPAKKQTPETPVLELSDMDYRTTMLTKFMEINLKCKHPSRELDTIKSETQCFPPNIRNKKRIFAIVTFIYPCTEVLASAIRINK